MSSIKKFLAVASLSMLANAAMSAPAYQFTCVTGDNGCTTAGTSVASWSLTGNVLTISNALGASNDSFITGISFDTSAGQSVALAASQMAGVVYSTGGGANLPASLGWTIDAEFSPSSKPATNSINAGESLAFKLTGVTLADIQSGGFKFGVHIQSLAGGRSEKLINISPVPEADVLAMALAGMGVVGLWRRRQR
jgi:MYXO-CTERM domain-containing protein